MKTAWSLCAIALLGLTVTAFAEDEDTGARRWIFEMSHGQCVDMVKKAGTSLTLVTER